MFERSDGGVWRTLTVQQIDLWRDVLGHACLDCGSKSQQGSALQTFVGRGAEIRVHARPLRPCSAAQALAACWTMSVGLPAGALNQTWLDQFQAWKHALDLGAGANAPLPIGLRRKICSAFAQARSVRVGLGVAEVADRHVAARGQGIDVVGHDAVRATLTGAVVQRPTVGNRAIGLETNLVGVLPSG